MRAIRLLQHNNPQENQSQTSQLLCLQVLKSTIHHVNNTQSQFKRMKNTSNINLNQLITPCKPPACSNTTTHHKTNFQYHKYRVLQVFKSNKILFVTSNQKYLFTFVRNEKHSQYVFKRPYNTMQAIRLL